MTNKHYENTRAKSTSRLFKISIFADSVVTMLFWKKSIWLNNKGNVILQFNKLWNSMVINTTTHFIFSFLHLQGNNVNVCLAIFGFSWLSFMNNPNLFLFLFSNQINTLYTRSRQSMQTSTYYEQFCGVLFSQKTFNILYYFYI
jgi:hypothetical protein